MPTPAEDQPVDSAMSQPPTDEDIRRMKTPASGGASPPPSAAKRARTEKTETKDDQTKTKTNDDQTTPPVQVLTTIRFFYDSDQQTFCLSEI